MKKETLGEKLIRKSFESSAVQKSWQIHLQAFGPILAPAFADDYQARIHLTTALNHISKRNVKAGLQKLQMLETACKTDADKAAWLFCMGLAMEMVNMQNEMISFYQNAGKYGHSFYLPYVKVAKAAHTDAVFDVAEENYAQAIRCLKAEPADEQKKVILGSIYTNYASCLTMMHRYEDAQEALQSSQEILPSLFGRSEAQAILEAARGNAEQAHALLNQMKNEPALYEPTAETVTKILENKHPHFAPIDMEKGWTGKFWDWFISNEMKFLEKLDTEDYASVFQMIQPKLREVFPFMERNLELAIEPRENFCQITFADFYMVSLQRAYRELIEAAPALVTVRWSFDITH
jgi:tetratricopeptide (TPR) repeat protein